MSDSLTPTKADLVPDTHPGDEHLEVHPAVALIIRRMESHPEEFFIYDYSRSPTSTSMNNNRVLSETRTVYDKTKALWNRKEKRLYNQTLRNVRLMEAERRLMAALLAGK